MSKSEKEEISSDIPNIKRPSSSPVDPTRCGRGISPNFGTGEVDVFYLYVIPISSSRYVVGWMLAYRESAELAKN